MELLIPGLILVGLMVYASTRIKRTAAEAFEPETVETERFTFDKPEGLLLVINGNPKFEAEGYSKEFGEGDDASKRRISFTVTRSAGSSVEKIERLAASEADVLSREVEIVGGTKFVEFEISKSEDGRRFSEFHKIGAAGGDVFDFCVTSIEDPGVDATRKISDMISSFYLK